MPFFSHPANADFLLPLIKLPLLLISSIFQVILAIGPIGRLRSSRSLSRSSRATSWAPHAPEGGAVPGALRGSRQPREAGDDSRYQPKRSLPNSGIGRFSFRAAQSPFQNAKKGPPYMATEQSGMADPWIPVPNRV